MENASKALIIAGGILIGVLIISLGVYLFQNAANLSTSYSNKIGQDNINVFNKKYLTYAKDLTPQEMVSAVNLISENNKKNINVAENQIQLTIDSITIDTNKITEDWKTVIMEGVSTNNEPKYKFISVGYNDITGMINQMAWRTVGGSIPIDEEIGTSCYHFWGEWTYVDDLNHERECKKCKKKTNQITYLEKLYREWGYA